MEGEARTEADHPLPGTLEDLISDAARVGLEGFNERLARDWHRRGLLGSPERQHLGRGRGSTVGLYSSEQRALFEALARNRAAGIKLPTLATLPVWAWLNYDGWVDLAQLRRALNTAVGNPRLSERVASQTAQLLLRLVDHRQGRPGDRGALRDELVDQLRSGRVDDARLLPKVKAVFQPSGRLLVARGPVGASMSAQDFTYGLGVRVLAARNLMNVTDEQLLTARSQHRASWMEYQQHREELAANAGSLAWLFRELTENEQATSSVATLLLLIGIQLTTTPERPAHEQQPGHRSHSHQRLPRQR